MKTDYKYGLGRDRRELSYYQSADWMDEIRGRRKKPGNCSKGEQHPRAILTAPFVIWLRALPKLTWELAARVAALKGVTPEYLLQLHKNKKRWSHI